MSEKLKNNQIFGSSMLYFDPVYRERSANPAPPPPTNSKPTFTAHRDPHAPYKVVRPMKLNEDGSVTISIYEPKAKEVFVCGKGCSLPNGPYAMEKNENGYFQCTITGLNPGYHHYDFLVDGVEKLNPEAPIIFGCGSMIHSFELPETNEDYHLLHHVPHGQIRFEHIWSEKCERYRGCWIYTPPAYDQNPDKRYPVLYIQHGGGENEPAWIYTARINYIADNLIAAGKMKEMIIVCNDGHAPHEVGDDLFVNEDFEPIFVNEIVPFIDKTFRTIPDRLSRAVAGLSMGAGQARMIVHSNPDLFAYLGQFSSGAGFVIKSETGYYGAPLDFSELFSTPEHYNETMKMTFISCGTEDPRHSYTSEQVKAVADQGYNVEYHPYPGEHAWEPWRMSLLDFMPRLFRD